MGKERFPSVMTDTAKLSENTRIIADRCAGCGIRVAGVIKGASGIVDVARAMVDGGAKMICSSRLEQLKRCKEAGIDVPLIMIRIPMLSEVEELVKIADISLNSEVEVLEALNAEALRQGKKHKVILMADLGDLREGFFDHGELTAAAVPVEREMDGLVLAGIGTNLGCYGSVMPTEDKMLRLAELAEEIERSIGRELEIVSGGATSSLMGVFDGYMPAKVNMLRIGAGILCGPLEEMKLTYGYDQMDALNDDVFTLRAEIIEIKDKASHPVGTLGVDAFGMKRTYVDRGIRKRALLAVGRADYGETEDIIPIDEGIEVIGASGDHTIIDIEDAKKTYKIGDIMEFKLHYSAIMRLTGSENVKHVIK